MKKFDNISEKLRVFFSGNERSVKAKKNVLASFGLQFLSIVVSLLYVPILLDHLGKEEYGIWLALISIFGWFTFFDVGLGNGLRNKLTETIAFNNYTKAREYVSTTYAVVFVSFSLLLVIFFLINPFLNWNSILNIKTSVIDDFNLVVKIIFSFFIFRFIVQIIGSIYLAYQMSALYNALSPLSNLLSFLLTIVLLKFNYGSFLNLAVVLSISPFIVYIGFSFYAFYGKLKEIRPSFTSIKLRYAKELLNLGSKFFFSQLASLVLFSLSSFILIKTLTPVAVTQYSIAISYFSVSVFGLNIVLSPIWSAVTDAYAKDDYIWMENTLRKINRIGLIFIGINILLLLMSEYAYYFWIGDRVKIPLILSVAIFFDVTWSSFSAVYNSYLNGFGKLKLSLRIVIIRLIVFIPMAIILSIKIGVSGVVWASLIGKLFTIFNIIQVNKILNKRATGIWNE